jgi:hypothetical protein
MANLANGFNNNNTEFRVNLPGRSVIFTITNTTVQGMLDTTERVYMALTEADLIVRATQPNKNGNRSFGLALPAGEGKSVDLGFINFYKHRITHKSTEAEVSKAIAYLTEDLSNVQVADVSVPVSDDEIEGSILDRFAARGLEAVVPTH